MMKNASLVKLAALMLAPLHTLASQVYVVPPGTAGNTPTAPYASWDTAANDLATVVGAASNGDTILVKKGSYSLSASSTMSVSKNLTIRSCDPDNSDAINAAETIFDGTGFGGSNVAIEFSSLSAASSIEGLTFANIPCTALRLNGVTTPFTISGCVFFGNGGTVNGGAIRFDSSYGNIVVTNCQFIGNKATGANGGAICHQPGGNNRLVYICDSAFSGNGADVVANYGGAIDTTYGIDVRRCTFRDFAVPDNCSGGAVRVGARSIVADCLFTGTMKGTYGAAINLYAASSICVSNCTFTGVTVAGSAQYGLVGIQQSAGSTIYGCSFTNNVSVSAPLMFLNSTNQYNTGSTKFRNCLVAASTSTESSSLFRMYNQNATHPLDVENCTIWMPNSAVIQNGDNNYVVHFRNSMVVGATGNGANATVDFDHCVNSVNDDFVAQEFCDYRLKSASSMVDAGSSLDWHSGALDIAGRSRVSGAAVDIGCYERQPGDTDYHSVVRAAVATDADLTGEWADAVVGISDAVDAAVDGGVILVKPGIYSMTGSSAIVVDKAVTIRSFGTEGTYDAAGTILDGTGFEGSDAVFEFSSLSASVRVEGLTLRNMPCSAMYLNEVTTPFMVAGCIFSNNGGAVEGGAIRFKNSYGDDIVVTNCQFSGNVATGKSGGAIYHDPGNNNRFITVCDCSFAGKGSTVVARAGGAINASGRSINIRRCTFSDFSADIQGGAIDVGTRAALSDCFFSGAMSATYGAAVSLTSSYASMSNCTFAGVSSGSGYGLISLTSAAEVKMHYCVITNNVLPSRCLVFFNNVNTSRPVGFELRNCLFAATTSAECGTCFQFFKQDVSHPLTLENCTVYFPNSTLMGEVDNYSHAATFRNCILAAPLGQTSNATLSYANCVTTVEGSATDGLAYVANPRFIDATAGDYSLMRSSPCRDAGALLGWMDASATDLAGNPRIFGAAVDIGCYENQEKPSGMTLIVR